MVLGDRTGPITVRVLWLRIASRVCDQFGKRMVAVSILSGSIVRVWGVLEMVLQRHELVLSKAERTMRVVRVEFPSGDRLIGAAASACMSVKGLCLPSAAARHPLLSVCAESPTSSALLSYRVWQPRIRSDDRFCRCQVSCGTHPGGGGHLELGANHGEPYGCGRTARAPDAAVWRSAPGSGAGRWRSDAVRAGQPGERQVSVQGFQVTRPASGFGAGRLFPPGANLST